MLLILVEARPRIVLFLGGIDITAGQVLMQNLYFQNNSCVGQYGAGGGIALGAGSETNFTLRDCCMQIDSC